jgi:hypothetical protein
MLELLILTPNEVNLEILASAKLSARSKKLSSPLNFLDHGALRFLSDVRHPLSTLPYTHCIVTHLC